MKKVNKWQEGKQEYNLKDGFMLKRADKLEFGIHETIYSGVDLELSFSWKKETIDKIGYDDHFWIFKDGKRIGGVHIGSNFFGAFFMEPPYTVDRFVVISALHDGLKQWSDNDEKVTVYGVTPKDIEHFQKLGYRRNCERRVMIRPTETFEDINWSDDFIIKVPTIDDASIIGKLFFECHSGGIDYEIFGSKTVEEAIVDAERILKMYSSNNTLEGSTLVFDKNTNQLVGACIAGINGFCDNDFSEIGEIVVRQDYRRLGLASKMIKTALTNLKKISPATILCVTIGNPSEGLYHNLGFFSGIKFTGMHYNK